MSYVLTGETLRAVVPSLTTIRSASLAALFNQIAPSYGMDSADVLQEFIAQVAWESQDFTAKSENLNYTAKQLLAVFGKKHFRTEIEALRYEHQPEKIANYVYGGRLGNNQPGDGWLFRGAGFIQLTGRDIMKAYGHRNKIEAVAMATLVRTDDKWALDSACWFYALAKGLVPLSKINTLEAFQSITRQINGGLNGEKGREALYARCKQFLIDPPAAVA